jgi:hypothetical protein
MRVAMRARLRQVAVAACVAVGLAVSGCQSLCTSAALAPEPSEAERARAAATSLPYAVVVEAGKHPPIYSERLVTGLRASGLFASVDLEGAAPADAPLVARVTHTSEGAAVIPLFTAITLGLFPTIAEETWGLGFTLEARDADTAPVAIDYRWSGNTWLGWLSALANLAPRRGGGDVYADPVFAEHVAATIAPHAAEIEALARHANVKPPRP